jgi:hypothetical protein
MDPDLDDGGLNQEEEEEEKCINDNLIYIEKFLCKLKKSEKTCLQRHVTESKHSIKNGRIFSFHLRVRETDRL